MLWLMLIVKTRKEYTGNMGLAITKYNNNNNNNYYYNNNSYSSYYYIKFKIHVYLNFIVKIRQINK